MLQQIPRPISRLIQAARAVIGWRVGTEEPPYEAEWLAGGVATAWFYDPPWTVPFLRRNEIAIPVGT
ncbi:hypothetical protein [Mycolicibacterium wolinskyi]|uniref:hypothetical protein n=1 Tax=Mycolicibacterium wolinskyi TaxID=59750 RepID=UPI0039178E46